MDKWKKREYTRHGKSSKYEELVTKFDFKYKAAANDHLEKNVRSLKEENPGKAYATLKKMGSQPGDCFDEGSFQLSHHVESNLSLAQSAEKIAEHFAAISQQYQPMDVTKLPKYVRDIMEDTIYPFELPTLSDAEVWVKIENAKKPKVGVPGDLPKKLIKEFAPELAIPITKIFQTIIKQQKWPSSWKIENGIPLQKVKDPINEDQLRIISLTAFFSKIMEQFVMEWLLFYIGDKIDWRQYGGQKGSSIAHYLIEFINFILANQDDDAPIAIIACMIDFAKAFNRIDHNLVVTKLSDMGVPGWLLHIVIAFLTDRRMLVRYNGKQSSTKYLPGGGPQGTLLCLLLFLVLINDIRTRRKT